jgi:hypothetical protein
MTERNDDNSDAWIYDDATQHPSKELKGRCQCGAPLLWDEIMIWCVNGECYTQHMVEDVIKDLEAVALKNYDFGGDRFVECFDRDTWVRYIQGHGMNAMFALKEEVGAFEREGKNLEGLYFVQVHAEDGTHNLGAQKTLEEALAIAKEFSEYAFNQFTENNRSAVTMYGCILEVVEHDTYIE